MTGMQNVTIGGIYNIINTSLVYMLLHKQLEKVVK
jgi:hypothetical protein